MRIIGIIPARYASSRFPGKPLADIKGKPMLQRVYEQALQAGLLDMVLIATDDTRIYNVAKSFGANVVMTSMEHQSGTERCYEAFTLAGSEYDAVVNIQGDEPFIDPQQIDQVCQMLMKPSVKLVTLCRRISAAEATNPNVVKIVLANDGTALYFSRSLIPYSHASINQNDGLDNTYLKHIGIYGYKPDVLAQLVLLEPTIPEICESLEQLRWLGHGYDIHIELTDKESIAVDTPDDIKNL
jgi:3-deoxy-manno-octulosonate cytidylyltransferase (CMP-KDO synthetase)